MKWMPIETRPTDGRVVLFCDASGNRWTDCSYGDCEPDPNNGCGYPGKFWTELPAPPGAD